MPNKNEPIEEEMKEAAASPEEVLLPPSEGLTTAEADELRKKWGKNELPEKHTPGWVIFVRCLWGPMPVMLWIAIIIEFALQNYPDGAILLAIQLANATIGWYETTKAGDAVAALKSSLKPLATVYRDGKWSNIDASLLVPGDKVKLASGSAIPADCTINEGTLDVDEAALTGESLPVTMGTEHMPKMGSTAVRGEVDATVQYTGLRTFFGKTALLLQSVEADLGNIHYVLVRVMTVLTSISVLLCIIILIYLLAARIARFKEAISFVVVLIVVSIPIAIEIVVTTTLALGSKELSKQKVIVTRLSSIEMMSAVNMLCSDKTGTLTLNKMAIQEQCFTFIGDHDRASLLVLASLAAKWREPPRDALDTMVLTAVDLDKCDQYEQLEYAPFDPKIKRTEAKLKGPDGHIFKVTKGAPNVVLELCTNKESIREEVHRIIDSLGERGIRCLAIAKTAQGEDDWEFIGVLTFLDPPRPDTKMTIAKAKEYGVGVKMITGDSLPIAKEMARMLNMDPNILTPKGLPQFPASGDPKDIPDTLGKDYGDLMLSCGGFAHVFPEHKFLIVETLRQCGYTCAMTGDGVNDAPALKRSDVGVAVYGATDAARAAADMVLTDPGLSVVVDAMLIARGVFQRMLSFLTYRISATLQLVFFFFLGVFILPTKKYGYTDEYFEKNHTSDEEKFKYFRLPVLMFMLITLLNDGTLMTIGYDNVRPSARPQRWNLRAVFFVSSVLSFVALISSLLLLYFALEGNEANPNYEHSLFKKININPITEGQIVTMLYLKVSISDFLTLFASRTGPDFFWSHKPSKVLMIGAVLSLFVSTMVAAFISGKIDHIPTTGLAKGSDKRNHLLPLWVWLYCVFWWLVQDITKVLSYKLMDKLDLFQYRTLALANQPVMTSVSMRRSFRNSRTGSMAQGSQRVQN